MERREFLKTAPLAIYGLTRTFPKIDFGKAALRPAPNPGAGSETRSPFRRYVSNTSFR